MRSSPSIIPGSDQDLCLVLDDFGHLGQAWRATNIQDTHIATVITDLLEGQYSNPVRVIAFHTSEGWSRDVSEDVARELQQRSSLKCASYRQGCSSSLSSTAVPAS